MESTQLHNCNESDQLGNRNAIPREQENVFIHVLTLLFVDILFHCQCPSLCLKICVWSSSYAMNMSPAHWLVMAWFLSTRAWVTIELCAHPFVPRCCWVDMPVYHLVVSPFVSNAIFFKKVIGDVTWLSNCRYALGKSRSSENPDPLQ